MSEIRPQEIASFWKFPILDIPIDKLGIIIKRNTSAKGEEKEWEVIDDPIIVEMLRFPITEEDILNVLGPGEYHILLKFYLDDGRHGLYGAGVFVTVGVEKKVAETPPEVVPPTPSPEIERLMANLAEHKETLAGQKAAVEVLIQTIGKLVDAQKSTDSQFKDQMLMKLIEKMGSNQVDVAGIYANYPDGVTHQDPRSNQVDVAGIYAKALDRAALFTSKRLDFMAASNKQKAELQRQESRQKHEIEKCEALIEIQQRIKAGKAGRAELKNEGSPKDDAKKTKVAPVVEEEETAEEPAPVKPRIISIGRARIKEPEPAEDESRVWVNKGPVYDPNDPRKQ